MFSFRKDTFMFQYILNGIYRRIIAGFQKLQLLKKWKCHIVGNKLLGLDNQHTFPMFLSTIFEVILIIKAENIFNLQIQVARYEGCKFFPSLYCSMGFVPRSSFLSLRKGYIKYLPCIRRLYDWKYNEVLAFPLNKIS